VTSISWLVDDRYATDSIPSVRTYATGLPPSGGSAR